MTTPDGRTRPDTDQSADPEPGRVITPTEDEIKEFSGESGTRGGVSRRTVLRVGAVAAAAAGVTAGRVWGEPYLAQRGLLSADGVFAAASGGLSDLTYIEAFPISPLILTPFTDPLPIPKALAPVPKSVYSSWTVPDTCVPTSTVSTA